MEDTIETLNKNKKGIEDDILDTANSLRWELGENLHDSLLESIYQDAAKISEKSRH